LARWSWLEIGWRRLFVIGQWAIQLLLSSWARAAETTEDQEEEEAEGGASPLEEDEEEGEVSEGIRACRAGFLAETRKEEGEEEERKRRERRARGIVRCMLFGGGRCHRGRKEREGKGRKGKEREEKGAGYKSGYRWKELG
jgi:hypothetical protein